MKKKAAADIIATTNVRHNGMKYNVAVDCELAVTVSDDDAMTYRGKWIIDGRYAKYPDDTIHASYDWRLLDKVDGALRSKLP